MRFLFIIMLTMILSACGKSDNSEEIPCAFAESSYIPNNYKIFTSASGFFLEHCTNTSGEEWEKFLDAVEKEEDAEIRVSYHCYDEEKAEEEWRNFDISYQDEKFVLSYEEDGEKKQNEYAGLKSFLDESNRRIWFLMVEEDFNRDLEHCLRFDYYQSFSSILRPVSVPKPWMVYFLVEK